LAEHGAIEKLKSVYGDLLVSDGSDGLVTLEYKIGSLPDDHAKAANKAALLKRNCFAAVFEKYFEAQVSTRLIRLLYYIVYI